jgi:hypothetical protein
MKSAVTITATLFLLALVAHSQPKPGKLTFSLTPLKDRVILLEPIPFQIGVENQNDHTVTLKQPITLQTIKLSIQKPDGSKEEADQLTYLLSRTFAKDWDMPPGAKNHWTMVLEFQLSKYFDQVGEYKRKAPYQNGRSKLSTGWATLNVEQPTGSDASAYDFLRNGREPSLIHAARSNAEREAFLERFPESPYSDYVRYSLATSYEEKEPKKAVDLLKQLQIKQSFAWAVEVAERLKRFRPSGELDL